MPLPSLYTSEAGPGVGVVLFSAHPLDASFTPADDAEAVRRWISDDAGTVLAKDTGGDRPEADDDQYPGRFSVLFLDEERLTTEVPQDIYWLMMIVYPGTGTRAGLTRDTSATTDKPAFELLVDDM